MLSRYTNDRTYLWASNGTAAGTEMINAFPGSCTLPCELSVGPTNPRSLTNVNGTLFFSGSIDSYSNRYLWSSDGTSWHSDGIFTPPPGNNNGSSGTILSTVVGDPGSLANFNGKLCLRLMTVPTERAMVQRRLTTIGLLLVRDIRADSSVLSWFPRKIDGTCISSRMTGSTEYIIGPATARQQGRKAHGIVSFRVHLQIRHPLPK